MNPPALNSHSTWTEDGIDVLYFIKARLSALGKSFSVANAVGRSKRQSTSRFE